MRLEERGGAEAAEAVEAGEDFVEDYGEAGPGCGRWVGGSGEEGGRANCVDEG